MSLRNLLLDDVATLFPITRIATEGLHQDRHARLMLDDQLQHPWVEVRPMIPAGASGDVHDIRRGHLLTVLPSIDVKARAIERGKGGSQAHALGCGGRNETVELRHAIGIERLQGTTESIIIELCGGNAGRNELTFRIGLLIFMNI